MNSDRAYHYIRERILRGEYKPGRPLMTDALSGEIGVSRTPVRDALRQLEVAGLVSIRPRLGASVKEMDLKEFGELCGLRLALETYAAGLAARHRDEADLREIGSALAGLRTLTARIVASKGPEAAALGELAREDIRFHLAIMTASKSELLKREIIRLQLINRIVAAPAPVSRGRPVPDDLKALNGRRREGLAQHQAIHDAIRDGDAAAAKRAMERHIQDLIDFRLRSMARVESGLIASVLTALG